VNDQLMVLTPEKTVVGFRIAGVGARIGAQLIDVMVLVVIWFAVGFAVSAAGLFIGMEVASGLIGFVMVSSLFLYFILQEWLWGGQTLGKKAVGVRVLSVDGTPITLRGAVYRNLLRPADFLPTFYFAGLIAMFMNERSQRLGDLAAGTIVVHEAKPNPHYQVTPHHAGIHPFEHSVGSLPSMTMEEYFAIKRLCDRFPELPPSVQVRSVEEIWRPFTEKERIEPLPGVHPVYQMEAVVMKYGRDKKLF
jgi:uncharacterized RDD family membrane protein YckC